MEENLKMCLGDFVKELTNVVSILDPKAKIDSYSLDHDSASTHDSVQ